MRVLLTGNDGYIGAIMSRSPLDGGHELVGLDRHLFTKTARAPRSTLHCLQPPADRKPWPV
jgi:nucleoside-diphosphate-sugar epimerase